IEQHPEVWDRSSEKYKGAKRDAWPKIVTALFPEWPNLQHSSKHRFWAICEDEMSWSVTDRYLNHSPDSEWQLAPRKRVPYGDQLKFILGSRSLRRIQKANISAQTPPDLTDGDTTGGQYWRGSRRQHNEQPRISPGNMSLSGRFTRNK
ncbi:unnamed protein product, partial [Ranitomeya imitator]